MQLEVLQSYVSAITNGLPLPKAEGDGDRRGATALSVAHGVGVIELVGPMMKGRSKYGGTSTIDARRLVREAMQRDDIASVIMKVESPGGHVAGTKELADDVRQLAKMKPVSTFIEDLGASAAYWIASATPRIVSNPTAFIGSIGTVAMVYDVSKMAEMKGIKVHVISTGEFKGAGAEGTPITDSMLGMIQERINDLNAHFQDAVAKGRDIRSESRMKEISDGRVHIASKALKLGLIDDVTSFDEEFHHMYKEGKKAKKPSSGPSSIDISQMAQAAEIDLLINKEVK